ncbi:hypothetical protein [Methylobacterium sp. J-090]|uniref:hypothetical protein n=1 Tax=Methylobacterium sp. J-090 TaxID=2836666 RepID=UPI001FBA0A2B|nr:hypothetical protein [Methylobacterium sp. J-090]MCJ2080445.1 hypothetical protein [Methylobacterium sp. J-090]
MPWSSVESGQRHDVWPKPTAWLALSLLLLAVSIDRHASIRWETGPRCGEARPLTPSTEADVREMLNHD